MSSSNSERDSPYSLPFDQYQRYRIVEQSLRLLAGGGSLPTVLDVGGAPGQLFDFLPDGEITVVDRAPSGHSEVRGMDGTDLDFPDRSFDYVVAVDVLEHIPAESRDRFLSEIWRVAKCGVLVAAPFDSDRNRAAEAVLAEFIRYRLKLDHDYLREHKSYGLPSREETRKTLVRLGACKVMDLPNGYLGRWLPMMLAIYYLESVPRFLPLRERLNVHYNESLYDEDNREPAYRHLLIATREPMVAETHGALEALKRTTDSREEGAPDMGSTLGILLAIATVEDAGRFARELEEKIGVLTSNLETAEARLDAREEEIKALRAQISSLTAALPETENHISNLENSLKAREIHLSNLQRELDATAAHARNLEARSRESEGEAIRKTQYSSHLEILLRQREEQTEQVRKHLSDLSERLALADRQLKEKEASLDDLRRHIADLEGIVEGLSRRYIDRIWSRLAGARRRTHSDPGAPKE